MYGYVEDFGLDSSSINGDHVIWQGNSSLSGKKYPIQPKGSCQSNPHSSVPSPSPSSRSWGVLNNICHRLFMCCGTNVSGWTFFTTVNGPYPAVVSSHWYVASPVFVSTKLRFLVAWGKTFTHPCKELDCRSVHSCAFEMAFFFPFN